MFLLCFISFLLQSVIVFAYKNNLLSISKTVFNESNEDICHRYENKTNIVALKHSLAISEQISPMTLLVMSENSSISNDPYEILQGLVNTFLFGEQDYSVIKENKTKLYEEDIITRKGCLLHSPCGNALRKAELFDNTMGVHLPIVEMMHQGHIELNITDDVMQTAVDAFAIFTNGNLDDIMRLPADYVLNSARTISMMKISHEKLAMTWKVVKGQKDPIDVTYETLELYRPLFKYLNGKEIARLNLKDPRILNYIGTHPDLDRHQVGVVASKYIKINPNWSEPKFLNMMNNLLCGVPMSFMRKIPENTYLQLSNQVFYHTRACDPLQRRFYLVMMTKTQALGKAYGWSAQDVSRLGLLLAEVEGQDLASIKPEALAGLTAQVMSVMLPENLQYLTEPQFRYMGEKTLNILARKLRKFQEQNFSAGSMNVSSPFAVFTLVVVDTCLKYIFMQ